MSRTYSAIKDKRQKQAKVHYQAYYNNPNEPRIRVSSYTPVEIDAELLENSGKMRQKFRRLARSIRNEYA